MIERIFPSWNEIERFEKPLTPGEKTLARFLDENLPSFWKIFIKPELNGSFLDIVILKPGGLMIFKVVEDFSKNNTPYNIKRELTYYQNKVIKDLIPEMGEMIDEDPRNLTLIRTGIYVHHLNNHDASDMFDYCRYPQIIGNDDLAPEKLHTVIRGYQFEHSNFMKGEWALELEFWLNPPKHVEKRTRIELTERQKGLTKPKEGHQRIKGVAGSGKTLIIANRAANIAKDGRKVLIITFNRALWPYIKDMVDKTPINFDWSYITFRHFHGFCIDFLYDRGIPVPSAKDMKYKEYLDEIVHLILLNTEKIKEKHLFDAILIDEGQDCFYESYDLLSKFLTPRNELLLTCDYKQNIFDREEKWMDKMQEHEGKVQFRGPWIELNTVHRLSEDIADFLLEFSNAHGIEHEHIEVDPAQSSLNVETPTLIIWENIPSDRWLIEIMNAYETLRQQQLKMGRVDLSDIVVLLLKKDIGIEAVEFFEEHNIPTNHLYERETDRYGRNKKAFWKGDKRLKISTVHNFKGWEAPSIIILIPEHWSGSEENLDAVVYTAISRAQKNLIILNTHERYWDFGERYSSDDKLNEDKIEEKREINKSWIETLPYPLASIIWSSLASSNYEHKVAYLLDFFEALAIFNTNLLLSGINKDVFFYEQRFKNCIGKMLEHNLQWYEKPTFGNWETLYRCLSSELRHIMKDKREQTMVLKLFEKPKIELLMSLTSFSMGNILYNARSIRNETAHNKKISEVEYGEYYNRLLKLLFNFEDIVQDYFQDSQLVIPVHSRYEKGIHYYIVKSLKSFWTPFQEVSIESKNSLDNSKIYLSTKNKQNHLELLPLILFKGDICYFINDMDDNGYYTYICYNNEQQPSLKVEKEDIGIVLALFSNNYH